MSVNFGSVRETWFPAHVNRCLDDVTSRVQQLLTKWTGRCSDAPLLGASEGLNPLGPLLPPRGQTMHQAEHSWWLSSRRQIASVLACMDNIATRVSVISPSHRVKVHPNKLPLLCFRNTGLFHFWSSETIICPSSDLLAGSVLSAGLKSDSSSDRKVNRTDGRREGQPAHTATAQTKTRTHGGNTTAPHLRG